MNVDAWVIQRDMNLLMVCHTEDGLIMDIDAAAFKHRPMENPKYY